MTRLELIEKYFSKKSKIKLKKENSILDFNFFEYDSNFLKILLKDKIDFWIEENIEDFKRRGFFSKNFTSIEDEKFIKIPFIKNNSKVFENICFKKKIFGEEVDEFFKVAITLGTSPIYLFEDLHKVYIDTTDSELDHISMSESGILKVEAIGK